jgi:tRNA(Leu) C34 or U34 (ribose-2'-O)-methylase TrmL
METSSHSVDLFEWQPKFPVCVAFGHEVEGLRPELLEIADTHVRIPMLGRNTLLNVATAAGSPVRIAAQILHSPAWLSGGAARGFVIRTAA